MNVILRAKLLVRLLLANTLSDKQFLCYIYKRAMHHKLNLANPVLFTEKIQWLKLYNRRPEYSVWVDKHESKEYVAAAIGKEHIIPTLGVWNSFDEIDFDALPDRFVLKTTHDSGGVVICKDKDIFDVDKARRKLNASLKNNFYKTFREWPYKNVPHRIIAEAFMQQDDKSDLTDYKFFCFNGIPKFCQVIQDRSTCETIDFFDEKWNHQEFVGLNPHVTHSQKPIAKPRRYDQMLEIAGRLSQNVPFLRVDLYEINGQVYFGELTFSPNAGFGRFEPSEWNRILGDLIELPNREH